MARSEFRGTERFRIQRRLGSGGMAVVYEVLDRKRNVQVALKTLHGMDAEMLYRLKTEFRMLQGLQHPNLCTLHELVEENGEWFLVMELVEGMDFVSWVRSPADSFAPTIDLGSGADTLPSGPVPDTFIGGTLDAERLRAVFRQLVAGLNALHGANKVHRDIKPSNVLVTPQGRVVILDFGLATDVRPDLRSMESRAVGTAAYMAPEQGAGRAAGPEADWYAVGVMLFEALTGRLPFTGPPVRVLMEKQRHAAPPPQSIAPDAPADLSALCVELTHFDPRARPTGADLVERMGARTPMPVLQPVEAVQSAPFLGREEEVALLQQAMVDSRAARATTVVLRGESGIGKSALVREFCARAVEDDPQTVVLSGRCYEREEVPYKAFDGVVDALSRHLRRLSDREVGALLPRHAALLRRVFPVLGRVELIAQAPSTRPEIVDPKALRSFMFAGMRELLIRLAELRPVLLAIDDLQWADADSRLLLDDLMRPPDAPPLLLLLSMRPESDVGEVGQHAHSLTLGPLPEQSARELARRLLGRVGVPERFADGIANEARGHPLLIEALVRHAVMNPVTAPRLRLEEAIMERVAAVSPGAREVLELCAVADTPLLTDILAQATRMRPDVFAREVSGLRVAHLIRTAISGDPGSLEPYHDRVREAVLAHLDDERRRERHARLAVVLESAGGQPEQLLRHLEATGQNERARQHAEGAAHRAEEALAFDRAIELYRAALRLASPTGDSTTGLRLRLAESLANAGRGPEAAAAFAAAAVGAEPAMRLDCQRQAAEQWLRSGHIERGLAALDAVLHEIGEKLPPTPRRAMASLLLRRAWLRLRGLGFTEKTESQVSREELTHIDVYKTVAEGLGMVDMIRGADFQARGLLLALRTGERMRVCRALAIEAIYVAAQGRGAEPRARELLAKANAIAARDGSSYLTAWAEASVGLVDYVLGCCQLKVAQAMAQAEEQIRAEATMRFEAYTVRIFRTMIHRQRGDLRELRKLVDASVRDAGYRGDRYLETTLRRAGSLALLAADNPGEARRSLELASWPPSDRGFHLQHFFELDARAELALYDREATLGLRELGPSFKRLADSLLLRAQGLRVAIGWIRGRLVLGAAEEAGADKARLLAEASRIARRLHGERMGWATTFALIIEAGLAAQEKRLERVTQKLRSAIASADETEMHLCGATARRRLGELLGGEEGAALIAQADEFMRGEGIVNASRMTRLYLPGFSY